MSNDGNEYRVMLDFTKIPSYLNSCEILPHNVQHSEKLQKAYGSSFDFCKSLNLI